MKSFFKILIIYLITSFVPPFILFANVLFYTSADSGQGRVLIFIASLLMLKSLLFINLIQFLALHQFKNKRIDKIFLFLYAFISLLLMIYTMINDYYTKGSINIDFDLPLISIITHIILCCFTFIFFLSLRKKES